MTATPGLPAVRPVRRAPWGVPAGGLLPSASDIVGAVIRDRQPRRIDDLSAVEHADMPTGDPAMWDGSLAGVLSVPLVQKHQGKLEVYTEPGRMCFEVWLPRRLPDESSPTA